MRLHREFKVRKKLDDLARLWRSLKRIQASLISKINTTYLRFRCMRFVIRSDVGSGRVTGDLLELHRNSRLVRNFYICCSRLQIIVKYFTR